MHEIYKQTLDFEIGGCKPKKANGTRWILHKLEAMKMCLDKWSLYIEHLEYLSSDKSIPSKDRQKMINYLQKWKQGRMPLMLAMFIELLEISLFLSLAFQKEKVDIVSAWVQLQKPTSV